MAVLPRFSTLFYKMVVVSLLKDSGRKRKVKPVNCTRNRLISLFRHQSIDFSFISIVRWPFLLVSDSTNLTDTTLLQRDNQL